MTMEIVLTCSNHLRIVITANDVGLFRWSIFGNDFYMSFVTRTRRRWVECRPIRVEEVVVSPIVFWNRLKVTKLLPNVVGVLEIVLHYYISWLWFLRLFLLRSVVFIAIYPLRGCLYRFLTIQISTEYWIIIVVGYI